jgi:hypothetical protein
MANSPITQTLGGPSHGVLGLIEISDKIARLSEAEYVFETNRRKLEHQFEATNSELREEYLAAVLEIHSGGENAGNSALTQSRIARRVRRLMTRAGRPYAAEVSAGPSNAKAGTIA